MPLKDPNYSMVPETTVRAFREMRGMVQTELGLYIPRSFMGAANGVATLDANSKVVQDPASFLPVTVRNAIQSCLVNGSTGLPEFLSAGVGRAVTLAGPFTVSFSNGEREFIKTIADTVQNAWSGLPPAAAITSLTRSGTTGTCICSSAHGFPVGAEVTLLDVTTAGWGGPWIIKGVPQADRFTFTVPNTLTTPATLGTNPRACPTVFLLIARDAVTGEISFPYTLLPPNDDPVRPADPVADQHWFDPMGYVMWRYDGAAWAAVQRLPVGECVVDTAGIVQYTCYAPLARYDSGWIDIVANADYPGNHGIGTIPQDEITILARAADGTIARVRYFDYSSAGQGVILTALTRKSYVLHTASLSTSVDSASWGGAGVTDKAAVQARIIMKRGY